jgi:uncharacterized protein YkwD
MLYRSLCGWLLAAVVLAPLPAYAQRVQDDDGESAASGAGAAGEQANRPDLARVRDRIVDLTNRFRHEHGRRELKVNESLSKAAQDFAEFMARTDKYGHTADGKEPWQRGTEHGYAYSLFAENIAWEYNSAGYGTEELARAFVKGWEESPPHRKNLLDPDLYDIGVGVAYSSHTGRYYAVQDFGRPKSKEITFSVTNQTTKPVKYTVDDKAYTIEPNYTMTYRRSRPPRLEFEPAGGSEDGAEETQAYHPRNGSHYVLRPDEAGGYRVVREGK